ncbi:hypothetical protein GHT06_011776 [Daphnia sinensis]|uniref:XRCC4 N-terminal domain-containing protein n=1 Tax=Daphnia sinensis TaxID=1820382 RepID=A0AAD5KUG5_9CRUS|nr:hypothetical protein GHT06_011776 [Daphnia sinensis]
MTFINVNVNDKSTYLLRLTWTENYGEVSLFDYENCRTWKGRIEEEQCQTMAAHLQLNLTDYKSQLEEAMRSPSSHHISFTNDILAIKRLSSKELSFRIAVIHLREVELRTSLPEFMAAIAKNVTEMSDELVVKDNLIEKLKKETTMLMDRCTKYVTIVEDLTPSLYSQFSIAFNHLKERLEAETANTKDEPSKTSSVLHVPQTEERQSISRMDDYEGDTDIDTDEENK